MAAADSTEPQARTRGRLCGPLRLEIDGVDVARRLPAGQAAALLCYLLASPDRAADRDELIAVLWPERPPRDPQGALRPILSRLRRSVEPAAIEGRDRVSLVLPEPVWMDVREATRSLEAARAAARRGLWEGVRKHSDAAARLLRPGFLPGLDGDWVEVRRREVEELLLEALELSARAALAVRSPDLSVAERASRELIAHSPYRETGYRFLMEALASGGNVAEGLRVYDDLRVLLRDQLGTAPAAEVQALHARLLAGEAIGGPPPSPVSVGERRVPLPAPLSPGERSEFAGRGRELDLPDEQELRFLELDGARVAYATLGSGPALLVPALWASHLERDWSLAAYREFFSELARDHTVIRYDRLGTGLSDRDVDPAAFGVELELRTLEALVAAFGLDEVALLGLSFGGCSAAAFAARRPELVSSLALVGAFAHGADIAAADLRKAIVATVRAHWGAGSRMMADVWIPGADAATREHFAELQRASASPESAAALLEAVYCADVRDLLPRIAAPTLVLHRRNDRAMPFARGRELAALIPGARLVALEGDVHLPWLGDGAAVLDALVAFLGGR
jgi:pimeloyl-ACP methyl ester carboxylesterase/DNA-binding SARP family transcriptional activator